MVSGYVVVLLAVKLVKPALLLLPHYLHICILGVFKTVLYVENAPPGFQLFKPDLKN